MGTYVSLFLTYLLTGKALLTDFARKYCSKYIPNAKELLTDFARKALLTEFFFIYKKKKKTFKLSLAEIRVASPRYGNVTS